MKKIILTTTNSVEFGTIIEYMGLIQTCLILGNNAVSEFISGFGGFSNTLRSKFDELYENASKEIEDKARKKGADAVVGMKVDFEELAGKGKSMFMISIVGTAVKVKFDSEADEDKYSNEELYVNNTALNFELTKDKILRIWRNETCQPWKSGTLILLMNSGISYFRILCLNMLKDYQIYIMPQNLLIQHRRTIQDISLL